MTSLPFNTLIGLTSTKDFRRILSSGARNFAGPVIPVILFLNPLASAKSRHLAFAIRRVSAAFRTEERNIRVTGAWPNQRVSCRQCVYLPWPDIAGISGRRSRMRHAGSTSIMVVKGDNGQYFLSFHLRISLSLFLSLSLSSLLSFYLYLSLSLFLSSYLHFFPFFSLFSSLCLSSLLSLPLFFYFSLSSPFLSLSLSLSLGLPSESVYSR